VSRYFTTSRSQFQVRRTAKRVWDHKWTRRSIKIGGTALLCLGFYQAGASTQDPRLPDNRPGYSVPEEMLHGKWDGIGTLPNGATFCMTQWPCEDQILKVTDK
jgi:hypothetical protein